MHMVRDMGASGGAAQGNGNGRSMLQHAINDYDLAVDAANHALTKLEEHGTPPLPRYFELWYAHVSGQYPALSEKIDQKLEAEQEVGTEFLDELYDEFLASPEDVAAMHGAQEVLDRQISNLMRLVGDNIDTTEHFADFLENNARVLPSISSTDQLTQVIQALAANNKSVLKRTVELSDGLNHAKAEVEHLRTELQMLREESMRDHLTGVHNRRSFDSQLARAIITARDHSDKLCLIMCDIDFFKKINDVHGHATGDRALQHVAKIMSECVKGQDIVARYGGEEFAVVLPRTRLRNAAVLGEQLRSTIEERPVTTREGKVLIKSITASFGVAELNDGDDLTSLIQRADQNLYQAKETGRNRVVCK